MSLGPVSCSQRLLIAAAAIALALLSACTDTREAPAGVGNIRAFHAMADVGEVSFQIEARSLDTPEYLGASAFATFDSLTTTSTSTTTRASLTTSCGWRRPRSPSHRTPITRSS